MRFVGIHVVALALIAGVGRACVSSRTTAALGETCTFNDECAAPLLCAGGRCRTPCRTDRDCVNNWLCRPSGQFRRRVCQSADEPVLCLYHHECDRPLICAYDGYCRRQCKTSYDCSSRDRSATCDLARGVCSSHVDYDRDAAVTDLGAAVDRPTTLADAPPDLPRDVAVDAPVLPPRTCGQVSDGRACTPGEVGCELVAMSSNNGIACAVFMGGSVRCWGQNPNGELGVGAGPACLLPGLIPAFAGVQSIAAGLGFFCAQTGEPTLRCWGNNLSGQLGTGIGTPSRNTPTPSIALAGAVYAGNLHACAASATRTQCWGDNTHRMLAGGAFATAGRYEAPIDSMLGVVSSMALGPGHSCALFSTGDVSCWGQNLFGELGRAPSGVATPTPMAVAGVSDAQKLVAGASFNCALLRSGAITCWGNNAQGQLGRGTLSALESPGAVMGISDAIDLTASSSGVCALRSAGAVWCWGRTQAPRTAAPGTNLGTPAPILGLTGARALFGSSPQCAYLGGGDLRCWGTSPGDGTSMSGTSVARVRWGS